MEPADFAVRIEEVMTEECTSYECVLLDENEIGVLWSFIVEDNISGYIGIDENEDTFKMRTVTLGLHLKEISDLSREELFDLLERNAELINANLCVVKIPAKNEAEAEEQEPVFVEEGEDLIFDDDEDEGEESGTREVLIIQTRLPFEAFEPDDFQGFVSNLLFQADMFLNRNEGEEEDDDLDIDGDDMDDDQDDEE